VNEERTLRMVPIDFKDGMPRDAKLATALQEFCVREFGAELPIGTYARVWAIVAVRDADYYDIMGVTTIANVIDCSTFHIVPLTPDKEGLQLAEKARDLAVYRMGSYLQDLGNAGSFVLIHVSETAERYWKRFLLKIKAEPAHRYQMRI